MKSKSIFLIILFTISVSQSQNNLDLPKLDYAKSYDEIEPSIILTIDVNNDLFFEGVKVNISQFNQELFNSLYSKFKNKRWSLPFASVELRVDSKVKFKTIKLVINKIKENGMFKVFFYCQDSNHELSASKKKGFYHRLNSYNYSKNEYIIGKVLDSINNNSHIEKDKTIENKLEVNMAEIPPPPPPPGINIDKLKKGEYDIPVRVIDLQGRKVIVNDVEFTELIIKEKISEWYGKNQTAFVISPDDNCNYNSWLKIYSEIYSVIDRFRDEYSVQHFGVNFNSLNNEKQNLVKDKYPIRIAIDD
jgi:biopolymer transport protein ExbD